MRALNLALVAAFVCYGSAALAQCTKDTDCKGNRVCSNGQCLDALAPPPPVGAPGPTVVAPPPPPVQVILNTNNTNTATNSQAQGQQQNAIVTQPGPVNFNEPRLGRRPHSAGWAIGAGIVGLVFSGVVLGLAAGADASRPYTYYSSYTHHRGDAEVSLPLSITSLVLTAVMVPVIASGGSSARRDTDLHGAIVLRVFSWIFYGCALAAGVVGIPLQILEATPDGYLIVPGALGAASLIFMAIDNFISFGQNRHLASQIEEQEHPTSSLEIGQYIAPVMMPNGTVGLTAGIGGRF
jgi:hypothetical protein